MTYIIRDADNKFQYIFKTYNRKEACRKFAELNDNRRYDLVTKQNGRLAGYISLEEAKGCS